ncbi:MAG: GHKL domain-containing protein [Erysipelotrichaceae bacterium]
MITNNVFLKNLFITIITFVFIYELFDDNFYYELSYYLICCCLFWTIVLFQKLFLFFMGVNSSIMLVFHVVILLGLFYLVGRFFNKNKYLIDDSTYLALLYNFGFLLVLLCIVIDVMDYIKKDSIFIGFVLIIAVYIMYSLFSTYRLINLIQVNYKKKYLEKLINESKKQIENIEDENQAVRHLRHDFQNHLLIINNLVLDNNNEDALKYLKSISHHYQFDQKQTISGLVYLDTVLNAKENLFPSIEFVFDVERSSVNIDEFDLCTVIFNLLDNAIKEVVTDDKPKIILVIKKHNDDVLINMSNSYKNLNSSKVENGLHGLGLKIVESVVNKYSGHMSIDINEDFNVNIIMKDYHLDNNNTYLHHNSGIVI